jgi:alpha-tubulin suppressor-like RCC1 family protein
MNTSAKKKKNQNDHAIVSFPEDVLGEISSWSTQKDFCSLRLTSTLFYHDQRMQKIHRNKKEKEKKTIKKIVAGYDCSFILFGADVYACGENECGSLGLGHRNNCFTYKKIMFPHNEVVIDIASEEYHTTFLLDNGHVYTAGLSNRHRFIVSEDPYSSADLVPKKMTFFDDKHVVKIAAGAHHTLYLLDDGSVYGIGKLFSHEALVGMIKGIPQKISFPGNKKVIDILAGTTTSFFILEGGVLYFSDKMHDRPSQFMRLYPNDAQAKIIHVAVAKYFDNNIFILLNNGSAYVRGLNQYGTLGLGHQDRCGVFTHNSFFNNRSILKICSSFLHTIFLFSDGTIYGCGVSDLIGFDHGVDNKRVPTEIPFFIGKKVIDVCVGFNHSLFLLEDGNIYVCGDNVAGQLGVGDERHKRYTRIRIPFQIDLPNPLMDDSYNSAEPRVKHL